MTPTDIGTRWLGSGTLAGVMAAVVFAWVHDLLISDIWGMIGVMGTAGGISGTLLAWTYGRMTPRSTRVRWLAYNGAFIAAFAVLPALSMMLFDPVMTFAEAAASEGPLDDLILEALPFTVIAVVIIAMGVSAIFGGLRRDFLPVLLTVVLLTLFLGTNLTIVGLVEFTGSQSRVIAGFVGLVALIGSAFTLGFLLLQWDALDATDG